MLVLGIESTAHTFGAGVTDGSKVRSNVRDMYVPSGGGIHPREAADHHVNVGADVVGKALEAASVSERDLELVAFSKGPGLGPCLRVGATIARVLSLKNGIPIIGANHCVAHLEIGGLLGTRDPVLLYASGGNTQIIAFVRGRYRVLGETLDIGIGNMLDKLGREMGMPFPAGPRIEKLARGEPVPGVMEEASTDAPELLDLPYSVKGMDVSFSGLMTAALALREKGADIRSICHSIQETSFSMLCEVAERAMAHIGASELLLGGGVACNSRLQEMASIMAAERGGRSFAPSRDLLVDNGAMIAYLGGRMYGSGVRHDIKDTVIDQRFRTDQVEVLWREDREIGEINTPGTVDARMGEVPAEGAVLGRGAEARITFGSFGGIPSVVKSRAPKGYRTKELEERLSSVRTRKEARMLRTIREAGVRTPFVLDVDIPRKELRMEFLRGPRLASLLNVLPEREQRAALREMGRMIGRVHGAGLVHGDLTTSNFILLDIGDGKMELGLIDCSLSDKTAELEKMGVDLRLFFEVFHSTHDPLRHLVKEFWSGYSETFPGWKGTKEKLSEISSRGRYVAQRWAS